MDKHVYDEPGMFDTWFEMEDPSLSPGMECTSENREKLKFILEVEAVIEGIKSGKIPGEYFEF